MIKVVVHCSDSGFGNAALISKWHTQQKPQGRGWSAIGYHYVILNGLVEDENRYHSHMDGFLEVGRPEEIMGAHCCGSNQDSIGVCLIGNTIFSAKQMFRFKFLKEELEKKYGNLEIFGHKELIRPGDPPKSCPNMDMSRVREFLNEKTLNQKEFFRKTRTDQT